MESKRSLREAKAETDEESIGSAVSMKALSAAPMAAAGSVGKDAVTGSRILKKFAGAEKEEDMLLTVTKIADKTFVLKKGIWVETGIENTKNSIKKIKFLSDEYFALGKKHRQIGRILALGPQVKFNWDGKIYNIFEENK
jgi:hypothetical protein